jgi:hypothetical protein
VGGDWGHMVGYCTHLLPVRSRFDGAIGFTDFLTRTKAALLAAYAQKTILRPLITRLDLVRDPARHCWPPSSTSTGRSPPSLPRTRDPGIDAPIRFTAYDFALNSSRRGSRIAGSDYNTDLFDAAPSRAARPLSAPPRRSGGRARSPPRRPPSGDA